MLVDGNSLGFLTNISSSFGLKAFLVLFLIFYSVFAIILLRQVQVMAKTLPTTLSPLLKFIAIIHLGVSLAILIFVIGNF